MNNEGTKTLRYLLAVISCCLLSYCLVGCVFVWLRRLVCRQLNESNVMGSDRSDYARYHFPIVSYFCIVVNISTHYVGSSRRLVLLSRGRGGAMGDGSGSLDAAGVALAPPPPAPIGVEKVGAARRDASGVAAALRGAAALGVDTPLLA